MDTIWAPVDGGLFDAVISCNVKWSFASGTIPGWIYVDVTNADPSYADTDYPIKVKVSENNDSADRECVLEFSSLTLNRKLVVEQKGTGVEPEPEPDTGE